MTADVLSPERKGKIFRKDPWKHNRRTQVGQFGSAHDVSIDEFPPPGFNRNELTVQPPPALIHTTAQQLDRHVQRGGPSTQAAHIEEALQKKEDGED